MNTGVDITDHLSTSSTIVNSSGVPVLIRNNQYKWLDDGFTAVLQRSTKNSPQSICPTNLPKSQGNKTWRNSPLQKKTSVADTTKYLNQTIRAAMVTSAVSRPF